MQSTAFIPLIAIIGILVFMALVSWIFQYRKKEKNKKLLRTFNELLVNIIYLSTNSKP